MTKPLLSLLALLACAAASAQGVLDPQDLYRKLSPSVWLVGAYDADGVLLGTGSAVVVGPETLLTNCHVLKGARRVAIRNDNVQHEAKLQYLDIDRDLCQITAHNLRAPAVTIGDSDALAVGQRVFALGNPRGLENTLSDGLVSALRRKDDSRELQAIQTTAPISPGSSGGGLFDERARLVGITAAQRRDGQNLNFAIPINWVRDLPARSDVALRRAGVTPGTAAALSPPRAQEQAPDVNDVAAIPVNEVCREEYRKFLASSGPRAFAIASNGKCAWQRTRTPSRPEISSDPDPAVRAMEICVRWYGTGYSLYAVDNRVLFKGPFAPARTSPPASVSGADLNDVNAVPVDAQCRDEYAKFLASTPPRAFAIAPNGKCAWQRTRTPNRPQITSDPDPAVRALQLCTHWHGAGCALYAIDSAVVYRR